MSPAVAGRSLRRPKPESREPKKLFEKVWRVMAQNLSRCLDIPNRRHADGQTLSRYKAFEHNILHVSRGTRTRNMVLEKVREA